MGQNFGYFSVNSISPKADSKFLKWRKSFVSLIKMHLQLSQKWWDEFTINFVIQWTVGWFTWKRNQGTRSHFDWCDKFDGKNIEE